MSLLSTNKATNKGCKLIPAFKHNFILNILSNVPANSWCNSHGLHVGNGGGASENSHVGGKWGLQAGFSLFAFQRFDESRLLTANVSSSAPVLMFCLIKFIFTLLVLTCYKINCRKCTCGLSSIYYLN